MLPVGLRRKPSGKNPPDDRRSASRSLKSAYIIWDRRLGFVASNKPKRHDQGSDAVVRHLMSVLVLWVALVMSAQAALPDYGKASLEVLVDDLTTIDREAPGLSAKANYGSFFIDDRSPEFQSGVLGAPSVTVLPPMRELVRRDAAVLTSRPDPVITRFELAREAGDVEERAARHGGAQPGLECCQTGRVLRQTDRRAAAHRCLLAQIGFGHGEATPQAR